MRLHLTILMLGISTLLSSQNFCGTISLTITKAGQTTPAKMFVCGSDFLARFESKKNGIVNQTDYLFNTTTGKNYLRTNYEGKEVVVQLKASDIVGTLNIVNINRTGEKKIINGYNCELLNLNHADGSVTESWITEDTDFDMGQYATYLKDDAATVAIQKLGIRACPIQSVSKDKNGKETYLFSITSINEGNVDKSLFKISDRVIQTK